MICGLTSCLFLFLYITTWSIISHLTPQTLDWALTAIPQKKRSKLRGRIRHWTRCLGTISDFPMGLFIIRLWKTLLDFFFNNYFGLHCQTCQSTKMFYLKDTWQSWSNPRLVTSFVLKTVCFNEGLKWVGRILEQSLQHCVFTLVALLELHWAVYMLLFYMSNVNS